MRRVITGIAVGVAVTVSMSTAIKSCSDKAKVENVLVQKKRDSIADVKDMKKMVAQTLGADKAGGIDSVRKLLKLTLPQSYDSIEGKPVAVSIPRLDSAQVEIIRLKARNAELEAMHTSDQVIIKKKTDTIYTLKWVSGKQTIVRDTVLKIAKMEVPVITDFVRGDKFYKPGDLKEFITIAPVMRYNITTKNFTPGATIFYQNGRFRAGGSGLISRNTGRLFFTTDLTFDLFRYPISRKK